MHKVAITFLVLIGLAVSCVAKEPVSLSVVSASARRASASIPEMDGFRIENCARVDVIVDIESALDQVLSNSFAPHSIYFVADLEPVYSGDSAVFETVRKVQLYATFPEDPIQAARTRRTFSFLVYYLGESSLRFRVRFRVPNREPLIDICSESFSVEIRNGAEPGATDNPDAPQ